MEYKDELKVISDFEKWLFQSVKLSQNVKNPGDQDKSEEIFTDVKSFSGVKTINEINNIKNFGEKVFIHIVIFLTT